MYLTEIAQYIVDSINSSSSENWGGAGGTGLVVPTNVTAKFALDPFRDSGTSDLDIFVIPGYLEFQLGAKRQAGTAAPRRKIIIVAVCAKISAVSGTPVYDVTTSDKAKQLIDLKEDLDNFLELLDIPGASLKEMDIEPIDELEVKDSFFFATTTLAYASC